MTLWELRFIYFLLSINPEASAGWVVMSDFTLWVKSRKKLNHCIVENAVFQTEDKTEWFKHEFFHFFGSHFFPTGASLRALLRVSKNALKNLWFLFLGCGLAAQLGLKNDSSSKMNPVFLQRPNAKRFKNLSFSVSLTLPVISGCAAFESAGIKIHVWCLWYYLLSCRKRIIFPFQKIGFLT